MKFELKNICFAYETEPILNNFSLSVGSGECVAIRGGNGSGKTTLLKILNGLLFAEHGEYFFDGEEITKKKLENAVFSKTFHQRIGYVFQNTDAQLFCNNVFDEISFGLVQMKKEKAEIEKRTNDMLKLLEIEKFAERAPYHLSSGEKKKVAIAAVLAVNPDVLILDEPLAFLDLSMQEWIVDFLLKLKKTGKIIIFVSHNENLINALADRVIDM